MLINNQLQRLKVLCTACALMVAAGAAQAQVSGSGWTGQSLSLVIPGTTPNVTFTSPGINFNSAVSTYYTIGSWLNTGGATGVSYSGGAASGDSIDNMIFRLTGSVYLTAGANTLDIGHDDGVIVSITGIGTVLNVPGPTAYVLSPYTFTAPSTGVYNFEVDYQEVQGPPAVLVMQYPNGEPVGRVPDGGCTVGLLGLGLTGLAALRKRIAGSGVA